MPMTPFDRAIGLRLLGLHEKAYELSGGLWGHRLGGLRMLLLRTTGRRTGRRRSSALLYHRDGDAYVVVGSRGGSESPPAWLLNIQADPEVAVQVGTRRFAARARVATAAQRRRLWPVMTRIWPDYERYQSQTSRQIPLVILRPVEP